MKKLESSFKKVQRIYKTEGIYGIWARFAVKMLGIHRSTMTRMHTFLNSLSSFKVRLRKMFIRTRIRREPIIVYQMGKVGSITIETSLKSAYSEMQLDTPIYHSHSLMNFEKYAEYIRINRGNSPNRLKKLEEMKELRRKIDKKPDELWNLISMVRDPVARNVAAFFQNIDFYFPEWRKLWENKSLSMQQLLECFFENEEVDSPSWFETKFEPIFGIDVYATSFPHQTGYKIYQNHPRANLPLIRLENLNQVAFESIYTFLRIPNFSLRNVNTGEQKPYADLYQAFKQIPMPEFYIKRMYSTKLARHFYTKDELDAFALKWNGKAM